MGPEQREPQELERYLSHLGLSPPSPAPSRSPTSGPGAVPAVVGTAMGPDQVARLAGFLEACQAHFPDHPVVVYALDLGTVDLLQASLRSPAPSAEPRVPCPEHVSDRRFESPDDKSDPKVACVTSQKPECRAVGSATQTAAARTLLKW